MPLIQARFDGKCFTCGGQLPKGSEIWYASNHAFHPACVAADSTPGTDQYQLADALGFRQYAWEELEPKGE